MILSFWRIFKVKDCFHMSRKTDRRWFNWKVLLVSLFCGGVTMAIVWSGMTFPLFGEVIPTDPREIVVTLGGAMTGPVGAVIIGYMAGVLSKIPEQLSSMSHIIAAVAVGLIYKKQVYERFKMPKRLAAWALLVLVYYYVFLIPAFILLSLTQPAFFADTFGSMSLVEIYLTFLRGTVLEVSFTTVFTTLVMYALPERAHRPLW
jgi:LytS/YehU family sensor histidine kinase